MERTVINTSKMREINCGRIFKYIYQVKETTKQDIASNLAVGLTSLTKNLQILEKQGLIARTEVCDSTGGRPAKAIKIVTNARISIGIEILKEIIHFAAIDLYGTVLHSYSYTINFESTSGYCKKTGAVLDDFIQRFHLETYTILGVSIAIQGIVSKDGSYIYYGKILNHTTLKLDDFRQFIHYPCRLIHDSKAAAALETWHQDRFKNSMILLLNNNFGSAVVINGQVHQGEHTYGGTFEHLCLNQDGPLCYCGKRGCLETYCSADSLKKKIKADVLSFFSGVRNQNDNSWSQIWQEYLRNLGLAIHNLTMVLDVPVILSGLLTAYFTAEDIEYLYQHIESLSPFEISRDFLHVSKHGAMSPAIGAALYDIDMFLESI